MIYLLGYLIIMYVISFIYCRYFFEPLYDEVEETGLLFLLSPIVLPVMFTIKLSGSIILWRKK